jgi:hypothetical protein
VNAKRQSPLCRSIVADDHAVVLATRKVPGIKRLARMALAVAFSAAMATENDAS